MSEPLDLLPIRARDALMVFPHVTHAAIDRRALLAEVDRLTEFVRIQRDEITDRANVEADLRAQLAEIRARDERIISMIRYGHASEGYGSRAVQDIWAVLAGDPVTIWPAGPP